MEALIDGGATVVRSPMISAHFNARIAFLMMPYMALVELIESALDRATSAPEAR